jgi:hypothetical protein
MSMWNGKRCVITHYPPCQRPGMDLSKMTRQEIEVLLRLLAEWGRRELALLMLERHEAERQGKLH